MTVVVTIAMPAEGRVISRDRYSGSFSVDEVNCGRRTHIEGTFHGTLLFRSRANGAAVTMFDHYNIHEVFTLRGGDGYIIDQTGLYTELRARLVRGTLYRFTAINVGQVFTVRTLSGKAVERNRGLFEITFLMDTQGDSDPSNDVFDEDSLRLVRQAGKHAEANATQAELCANIAKAIAG